MRAFILISALTAVAACDGGRDLASDDCRCEGGVPEGYLSAACGESVCIGGVGYVCTGVDTADFAPEACLLPDASMPFADAGPGGRDAGPGHDAGVVSRDAGDTSRDAGHTTSDAGHSTDAGSGDCTSTMPECAGFPGTYGGSYVIYTAERLGSTIINEMRCTGSSSLTVDFSATPALSGTVTCNYPGSLGGFDSTQNGTVEARVRPDGTIRGTLTHQFDAFDSGSRRTFSFDGTIGSSGVDVMDTASWRPHPMSAVPWDVDITIDAAR